MTTVVLADDEALLRKAMTALLPLEGEITVLAEAEDGERWIDPDVSALALVDDCHSPTANSTCSARRLLGRRHRRPAPPRGWHRPQLPLQRHAENQTRTRHEAARYAREHDWL